MGIFSENSMSSDTQDITEIIDLDMDIETDDTMRFKLDRDQQEIINSLETIISESLRLKNIEAAGALMKSNENPNISKELEFVLPEESVTGYKTPMFIIHPAHPLKIKFDLAIGALIMYSIIAVPFRIGFRVPDSFGLIVSDAIVDSLFGIDIILTFRTAYFNEELVGYETNPIQIAYRYICDFFFIDLISTLPFNLFGDIIPGAESLFNSSKLLRILRLARLIKLVRVLKLSGKGSAVNDPYLHPSLSAMLQMTAVLLFMAHMLACLWFFILDEDKDVNWLNSFGGKVKMAQSITLLERYIISLYWAFTTMSTVGYGDIVATNQTEYVVCVFGMLVGATMFGYVIGNVTAMMDTFDPEGAQFDNNMDRISSFVMDRKLSDEIAHAVKNHFQNQYKRTTVFESVAEDVLSSLPAPTACAAVYCQYKAIIDSFPYLSKNDPLYVHSFVKLMHWFSAAPLEIISKEGDLAVAVFMLEKGIVTQSITISDPGDLDDENTCEHFDELGAGVMFGEASVILNTKQFLTSFAKTSCELWFLSKEELGDFLESWPNQRALLAQSGFEFLERVRLRKKMELSEMIPFSNIAPHSTTYSMGDHLSPKQFLRTVLPYEHLDDDDEDGVEQEKDAMPVSNGTEIDDNDNDDVEMTHRTAKLHSSTSFEVVSGVDKIATAKLFHPDSSIKVIWDVFVSIVILYSVVTLSYQLGFRVEFEGGLAVLDWMVDVFFALDIMVTFNTAIVDADNELICDRKVIAIEYLKGWFTLDFVSTVPFVELFRLLGLGDNPIVASLPLIRSMRLVRLAKIARIVTMSGVMDSLESFGIPLASLRLAKLLVVMLFFAHLLACLLYAVADCRNGPCWVQSYCEGGSGWFGDDYVVPPHADDDGSICLLDRAPAMRFLVSFYYSFTTMTTIGYGDISPNPFATHEIALTIFIQVIGTTLFAYVIGALIHLIMDFDPGGRMRTQNLLFLNQYLTDFHCTLSFRRCLRSHFLFREKIKSVFDENQLLSLMPPVMRNKVVDHINQRSITRLPLLCKLERSAKGAFSVLLPKLNPYCFRTGDVVLHPMLGTHREMFFVHDGEVSMSSWTPLGAKLKAKKRYSDAKSSITQSNRSNSALTKSTKRTSEMNKNNKSSNGNGEENKESVKYEKLQSQDTSKIEEKKFYGVGSFFGECLVLIPDERGFQLEVEVVATCLSEVFGLTRPHFLALVKHFPGLSHQLKHSLRGAFKNSLNTWVDMTPAVKTDVLINEIWPPQKNGGDLTNLDDEEGWE